MFVCIKGHCAERAARESCVMNQDCSEISDKLDDTRITSNTSSLRRNTGDLDKVSVLFVSQKIILFIIDRHMLLSISMLCML